MDNVEPPALIRPAMLPPLDYCSPIVTRSSEYIENESAVSSLDDDAIASTDKSPLLIPAAMTIPSEVASAITTIMAFLAGYITPPASGEVIADATRAPAMPEPQR